MLTEEDFTRRSKGIGGSDVAPILGLSSWSTPLDIYYQKIGAVQRKSPTVQQKIGHLVEERILIPYYEETYDTSVKLGSDIGTIYHKDHHELLAHIDGLDEKNNRIIECKSVGRWKDDTEWGDAGTDEVPIYVSLQVNHYMEILNIDHATIIVLFAGNIIEEYYLERNKGQLEGLTDRVIPKLLDFWHNNVLKESPPPPKTLSDISLLFPYAVERKKVNANECTFDKIRKFITLDTKTKEIKKEIDDLKKDILGEVGDAEIVTYGEEEILTYKNIKNQGHRRLHVKKGLRKLIEGNQNV